MNKQSYGVSNEKNFQYATEGDSWGIASLHSRLLRRTDSPDPTSPALRTACAQALADYRSKRENGSTQDNPSRPFPADGKYSWKSHLPRESRVKYTAGRDDRRWMEERDSNYLERVNRVSPQKQTTTSASFSSSNNSIASPKMKTQDFGVSTGKIRNHIQTNPHYINFIRFDNSSKTVKLREEAVTDYKSKRMNGEDQDKPNRAFPEDGAFYIDKKEEKKSRLRYQEGSKDCAWMEEMDSNYIARQEREKQSESSTKTKPNDTFSSTSNYEEEVETATLTHVDSIPYSQLSFSTELGRGGFGVVYKGRWQNSDVAIKQLLTYSLTPDALEEFKQEARIMGELNHPHVVTLWGVSTDQPGKLSMVMELMPKASLFDLLHNGQPIEWSVRYQIAKDITAGLGYLHGKHIVHRDLKSLNVLLGHGMRAKLTDFGLAKVKSQTHSTTTNASGNGQGTIPWMAPEQFALRPKFTKKSDIYSFGMILWELASREIPYAGAEANVIMQEVRAGEREEMPDETPASFARLIKQCWKQDPAERPTTEEAVEQLMTLSPAAGPSN